MGPASGQIDVVARSRSTSTLLPPTTRSSSPPTTLIRASPRTMAAPNSTHLHDDLTARATQLNAQEVSEVRASTSHRSSPRFLRHLTLPTPVLPSPPLFRTPRSPIPVIPNLPFRTPSPAANQPHLPPPSPATTPRPCPPSSSESGWSCSCAGCSLERAPSQGVNKRFITRRERWRGRRGGRQRILRGTRLGGKKGGTCMP